jgi:colicin import membrane protein
MKAILWAICLVATASVAQVTGGDSLEAVEAERQQLQAQSAQAEAVCHQRFAANACLSEVAAQRRKANAALKKRELILRDAQRAERTREQLLRLKEKALDQEQRLKEASITSPHSPAEPKVAPRPAAAASSSASGKAAPISPGQAAANRAAFIAKQEEALRHKAELEKRLSDKKDRAGALPTRP